MHFPLAYTGEVLFYKPDDFNTTRFFEQIQSKVSVNYIDSEKIIFTAPFSFSKLPVKITLSIIVDNSTIFCKYNISLFENNVIILSSLVFAGFFYNFGSESISIVSILAGVIFYLLNTAEISKSVKSLIYNIFGNNAEIGEPVLWEKQQQWMKDKTLCPACGEPKNQYSSKCLNCGLFLDKGRLSETYSNINIT